ncbi:proline racemase family protein [Streptomyces sp. NPDC006134]|uniref:proline racemase family protein n=1 Tax=Streptomyces sp. NPDC006134 TaxID=3154467 RepID=UPI00340FF509
MPGSTTAGRLEHCRAHLDGVRRLLPGEPRGYPGMRSALVLPPTRPEADFGPVVMTQSGSSPLSGTNSIRAFPWKWPVAARSGPTSLPEDPFPAGFTLNDIWGTGNRSTRAEPTPAGRRRSERRCSRRRCRVGDGNALGPDRVADATARDRY